MAMATQEPRTPAPGTPLPRQPPAACPSPSPLPATLPAARTPRQSPTHSKPPGPRRPPAAPTAAGAGRLPAALCERAIAGSSALQERSRHHSVVPRHHPAAGAFPRQRLLPDSHLGWALLSPAPAARSRRDCHRHRGRWMRGQQQTSGRHRPHSVPCPGRLRRPCGLSSASKEKCSWFLQKQKCAEVWWRGKYCHSTGVLPLAGHHHLVPLHTPKTAQCPLGQHWGSAARGWSMGHNCGTQPTENSSNSLRQGREDLASSWEQVALLLTPSRMEVPSSWCSAPGSEHHCPDALKRLPHCTMNFHFSSHHGHISPLCQQVHYEKPHPRHRKVMINGPIALPSSPG